MHKRLDEESSRSDRFAAIISALIHSDPANAMQIIARSSTYDSHPFGLNIGEIAVRNSTSKKVVHILTSGDDNIESVSALLGIACTLVKTPSKEHKRNHSYLRIFQDGRHRHFEIGCQWNGIFIVSIDLHQAMSGRHCDSLADLFELVLGVAWGVTTIQASLVSDAAHLMEAGNIASIRTRRRHT